MEQTVWIFGDRSPATSPFAVCVRPTRAKPREIARRDVRRASARSRPAFRDKPSSRRPHLLRAMMSHASALGSSAPLARGLGAAPPRGRATRSSPRGAGVSLASGRTPTASTSRVSPRDPHRVGGVPSRAASARPSPFVAARRPAVALRAAAASPADGVRVRQRPQILAERLLETQARRKSGRGRGGDVLREERGVARGANQADGLRE